MSVANRKTVSAIIWARGVGMMICEQDPDKEAKRLALLLISACDKYPWKMDEKDNLKVMQQIITKMQAVLDKPVHASVHVSFALALIDEPLAKIKNSQKLMALQRVRSALNAIHRHYEATADQSCYDLAANLHLDYCLTL